MALVLAKDKLGHELSDAEKLDKLEKVSLLRKMLLSKCMSFGAILTLFVALGVLEAAAAFHHSADPPRLCIAVHVLIFTLQAKLHIFVGLLQASWFLTRNHATPISS